MLSNRYAIYNDVGQKVLSAVEKSNYCAWIFLGELRPFEMVISDNAKNELIHLSRPLACNSCLFPWYLQVTSGRRARYLYKNRPD